SGVHHGNLLPILGLGSVTLLGFDHIHAVLGLLGLPVQAVNIRLDDGVVGGLLLLAFFFQRRMVLLFAAHVQHADIDVYGVAVFDKGRAAHGVFHHRVGRDQELGAVALRQQ